MRLPAGGALAAQDHPRPAARRGSAPREIDAAVRKQVTDGEAIYELDTDALHDLEPDLIVTQELCPVCAVSYEEVLKEAELIESCPKVIALDPSTIGEAMGDIRTIARATHTRDAGARARRPLARPHRRGAPRGPRRAQAAGRGDRVV